MASRGCLCDKPPVKTLGTEFLMSFPDGEHFIPVAHDSLLQEQSMTWTTALREDSRSPSLVTSGLHPCTLPFADFALCFFFFFLKLVIAMSMTYAESCRT